MATPISTSTSPFRAYPPFLAKFLVPPSQVTKVLPPFNKRRFQLCTHTHTHKHKTSLGETLHIHRKQPSPKIGIYYKLLESIFKLRAKSEQYNERILWKYNHSVLYSISPPFKALLFKTFYTPFLGPKIIITMQNRTVALFINYELLTSWVKNKNK